MIITWYKIKDLIDSENRNIPEDPGIYFVRRARNGYPVPIPRLGGQDNKGILYIGESKNIRRRIGQLINAIVNDGKKNTIYKTKIFCSISKLIKLEEYEITWEKLKTHEEAKGQEWAALKLYCDKYHEAPPLNLSLSRELFAIVGIARVGRSRVAYEADGFVKSIIL